MAGAGRKRGWAKGRQAKLPLLDSPQVTKGWCVMGKWTTRLETSKSSCTQPREPREPLDQKGLGGFLGSIVRPLDHFQESSGVSSEITKTILSKPADENSELDRQLLEAAIRACDFWGDSQAARIEMVADIKATPHHLRKDLLEHFLSTYVDADTHLAKATTFD